jgi:uncharacterized protein (TIGR01777 family)
MATVLITGGTGMIGKALTDMLVQKGHRVIVLTRKGRPASQSVQYAAWDIKKQFFPDDVLRETDYIVHLAGANVGQGRWTTKRKAEILMSRTHSSELLINALKRNPNRVKAVISASGIGWYGPDNGSPFRESDPPAPDFLGNTCRLWEASVAPMRQLGKRLVIFRTGIVLAREGGAFPAFRGPLRAGIAAILGSGKQVISWIHLQDICRLYVNAIEDPSFEGIYNASAPAPVTNKALVLALARRLKGRFFIPVHVPSFVLKILLGEMSIEILKSCTADPKKVRSAGFQFTYPTLEAALNDLV